MSTTIISQPIELALIVEDIAAAEPGFQEGAVFAFPFAFNGLEVGRGMENFGQRTRMAETKNDVGSAIGGDEIVAGIVAEHGGEGLIDVEEIAAGITMANAVSGIVEESAIEGLRMAQSLFGFFEFGAELLFLKGAANDHGQLGNMLALDVLERAMSGEFGEVLRAGASGQEDQSALLNGLHEQLERLGTFDAGAGVFDDDDIVGGGTTVARAMGEAGDGIRGNDELALFESVEAGLNGGGITMNEEDVERAAPMRRRRGGGAYG